MQDALVSPVSPWRHPWRHYVAGTEVAALRRHNSPFDALVVGGLFLLFLVAPVALPEQAAAVGFARPDRAYAAIISWTAGILLTLAVSRVPDRLVPALDVVDTAFFAASVPLYAYSFDSPASALLSAISPICAIFWGRNSWFSAVGLAIAALLPFGLGLWLRPGIASLLAGLATTTGYSFTAAATGNALRLRAERDAATRQAVQRAERLSVLAQLASGMAHELNRHLTVVRGFAQRIQRDATLSEQTRDELTRIERATTQMAELVRTVRAISRSQYEELMELDPVAQVSAAAAVTEETFERHRIELELPDDEPAPLVWGTQSALQHAFINLLANAADALCDLESSRRRVVRVLVESRENEVEVAVEDSGDGVDPEIGPRLFDPWVTSKTGVYGLGLGLWLSRSLIERQGGRLGYSRAASGGARFSVVLRRTTADPSTGAQDSVAIADES